MKTTIKCTGTTLWEKIVEDIQLGLFNVIRVFAFSLVIVCWAFRILAAVLVTIHDIVLILAGLILGGKVKLSVKDGE